MMTQFSQSEFTKLLLTYFSKKAHHLYARAHHRSQYLLFTRNIIAQHSHVLLSLVENTKPKTTDKLFDSLFTIVENAFQELEVISHGQLLPVPVDGLNGWYSFLLGWAKKESFTDNASKGYVLSLTEEGKRVYQSYKQILAQYPLAKED